MSAEPVSRPTVSAVVTSCRRFDLLEETLRSFVEHNDYPLDELIVIEDSDDRGVYAVEPLLQGVKHRIILNGRNLGQIASIDKAYGEVKSDYIFHMEDDWLFTEGGFIERSIEVLEKEPQVILVTVRDDADMPRYVCSLKTRQAATARYKLAFPELHFLWHTFTFNPGLRRTRDYQALPGGYTSVGDEASISRYYKAENREMAWLVGGGVRHTGHARSTYGTGWGYRKSVSGRRIRRLLRRQNLHKWRESLKRRFWHILRLLGIDTERFQRRRKR
jgi:glycosyltransferase involved in cell wall biosynthesis